MTLFYLHEVWTYSPWLVVRVGFTNWDYFPCKSHVDPIISYYIHVIFPDYPLSILSLIHIITIIPIIIWIIWYSHIYIQIMFYTYYPPTIHRLCLSKINVVDDIPIYHYPHYDNIILWMVAKSCTSWKLVANYVKDFQLITLVNNTSWKFLVK